MTTFWPGTKIPKSTGNGFDLSLAPPSGFATAAELVKAKRNGVDTCDSFTPLAGLSQKARKALQVPAKRVAISITKRGQESNRARKLSKAAI